MQVFSISPSQCRTFRKLGCFVREVVKFKVFVDICKQDHPYLFLQMTRLVESLEVAGQLNNNSKKKGNMFNH